ncbi:MAG: PAS domain-containing protein [Tatlockia sp.]|nr:PAS domain-containing protein [Tatlockia sp.]
MKSEPLIVALAHIIPLLPGCAWLVEKNGLYRSCNAEQAALFGLNTPSDIVEYTNETLPLFKKNPDLKKLWEKNTKKVLNLGKSLQFESPFKDLKGQIIRYQTIPLLDKEQLVGIVGISLNDYDKPLLQQILVLKNLLDNLPEHVYWKDNEGVYLGCNLIQANDLNLQSSEAIIGKTDYDLSPKDQADAFREIDQQVIAKQKKIEAEEIILKNDKYRVVLSKKIPLFDHKQGVIGVLGISFDVTELKETQKELCMAKDKAEAANYIMTEFIANMGHDLATPISDVGSIAQVLNCYSDEYPELKELFETLETRASACEVVRKSIINATSISNLENKPEIFSIVQELLALETELRPTIGSKNLKLIIQPLKSKKEDRIETDRTKFHKILYDLMSNAINFTEEGQVTVSVLKEDKLFHIKVSDTGIGFPSDKYDYIFEQYTKLSRSNKFGATFKGVGAGQGNRILN